MTIEQRLQRLEKANHRYRIATFGLIALASVFAFAAADEAADSAGALTGNKLVLRTEEGNTDTNFFKVTEDGEIQWVEGNDVRTRITNKGEIQWLNAAGEVELSLTKGLVQELKDLNDDGHLSYLRKLKQAISLSGNTNGAISITAARVNVDRALVPTGHIRAASGDGVRIYDDNTDSHMSLQCYGSKSRIVTGAFLEIHNGLRVFDDGDEVFEVP